MRFLYWDKYPKNEFFSWISWGLSTGTKGEKVVFIPVQITHF
jgi:hypothetical protein